MLSSNRQTTAMELAAARLGKPLRTALLTEFAALPPAEISERLNISPRTLERWMERLGLERRSVIVAIHHDDATPGDDSPGEKQSGPGSLTLAGVTEGSGAGIGG